jgi:hypothetical protein
MSASSIVRPERANSKQRYGVNVTMRTGLALAVVADTLLVAACSSDDGPPAASAKARDPLAARSGCRPFRPAASAP